MPPRPHPSTEAHDPLPPRIDRPAIRAALRARLNRAGAAPESEPPVIPLCPEIDRALPGGGLPRAALHEILSDGDGGAAGFGALLMARSGRTAVWIARGTRARLPGLAAFGLLPSRLVVVRPGSRQDALWVAEEALRCPAVSAALLADEDPDDEALRRLQLAAETGGGIGLLLREGATGEGPSPAATRWRVTGGAPHELGDPQWQLDLLRGRTARPLSWPVTWRAGLEALVIDDAIDDGTREEEAPRGAGRPGGRDARQHRATGRVAGAAL